MAGLIDIGANLAHESFHDDREAVLERAWAAGLDAIIVTGSSRESSIKALELARAHPRRLYATAGLHPHHAAEWNAEMAALMRELAQDPQLVCLGECGLDYFRDFAPRDAQRRAFIAQLQLAAQLRKPLFLHQRDAHADFLPILREFRPQLGEIVVHCFTDTRDAAAEYVELGCCIGITGWICDERRGVHLLDVVREIPAGQMLIETDAPYLLPRTAPKQASRRNEPCLLGYVVATIARARGETAETIAATTAANARRAFGLASDAAF